MIINSEGTKTQNRNDIIEGYFLVPTQYLELIHNNLGALDITIEENQITNIEVNELKKQQIENEDNLLKEIEELKNWFNTEYRTENEKATRLQALSIAYSHYDEYRDKTYTNLNDLYQEAEIVRARINELESELI